jgi:Putative bacterial sensory transduction regulator
MSDNTISKLTLDSLREILQLAGYRVETVTDPVANIPFLRSATNGLAFDVRPGNRFAGDEQSFVDVALVAVLQVQGELPLDVVNRWNATRRFARLQLSQPFLALSLDFSVAGGVTQNHLRAQIEIWDYLIQQLIIYLREELASLAKTSSDKAAPDKAFPTKTASAEAAPAPAAPEHDGAVRATGSSTIQ